MSLKPYPAPIDSRSGCKVSWNYYRDEALAKLCSEAARSNMRVLEAKGYDFGYQSPGSITKSDDGLYKVCLP